MDIKVIEEEVWKVVEGFPDYSVSNLGRMISRRTSKEKFVAKKPNHYFGYTTITLRGVEGDSRRVGIHRVVAEAFIPKPVGWTKDYHVNHIDGDPTNNTLENLEWCTRSENYLHPNCHRKRSKEVRVTGLVTGISITFLNASVASRALGIRASNLHQFCNTMKGFGIVNSVRVEWA